MLRLERIEEGDEGEEGKEGDAGEVSELVSHKVNEDVTLSQPELCVIYSCLHWALDLTTIPINDAELKQIIGHALLELDNDKYLRLDLEDVIMRLRDERDDLTKLVKVPAESLKSNWLKWIPQLQKKSSRMLNKDEKLAKQRNDELAAQQASRAAAGTMRPNQRRRIQDPENGMYPSISAVLAESSSGSQGVQGQGGVGQGRGG